MGIETRGKELFTFVCITRAKNIHMGTVRKIKGKSIARVEEKVKK